jgi:ABC-2 type transport system ATP-binding protein
MIKTDNLSKNFFRLKALDHLNLDILQGKVYGVFGPNGSGKTTLFKILDGLNKPSAGSVLIKGFPVGVETKKRTAFMPAEDCLYKWMKIKTVLNFYQDMYEDFDRAKATEHLDFMELKEEMKVGNLSTGMKARLKLAVTLARKADLYLLDEPLNGIDPISRDKTLKMIVSSANDSCTMMISSHLVNELETLLDEVIFLDKGKVILVGEAEKFRIEKGCSIEQLYKEVYHG